MNLNNLDNLFPKKRPATIYLMLIVSMLFYCNSIKIKEKFNEYSFYTKHYKYMTPEAYQLVSKYLKNNVDKAYVFSVIEYESADHKKTRYNWEKMKTVYSPSKAIGPLQLMKFHGTTKQRLNVNYNIMKGVSHLSYCVWLAKKRGYKNSFLDGYRFYNRGHSLKLKRSTYNFKTVKKIMKKYYKVKKALLIYDR